MRNILLAISIALVFPVCAGEAPALREVLDFFAAKQIESKEIAGLVASVGNREGLLATATAGFSNIESGER